MIPQTGDIVRVRARQYLVEGIELAPNPTDSALVRLSCLEDDSQGDPLEVLWDREIDARLISGANWEQIASRGFDAPRLFSAYLHTLRWNCVTATDERLFQAPYRAGIEVKSYQLEPLRVALGMPRVNLFIADDVGLGKTIEAGLILREMLMRQKVRRCVICVPPSVVRQWRDEMEERFGLPFVIYDRDYVARVRQERGWGINPWKTHTRFIISHALVRDEVYAAPLRDWLGVFSTGSLLILDEAHNVAPSSGAKYALDSKLTRAMRDLAPRFEHRLFLSATPHNGHSNSFSALLELLDPQRFCRGVPVEPKLRDEVMVRRLKSDLRAIGEQFPKRNVLRVLVDSLPESAPELQLSKLLQAYRFAREARLASATKLQQASALLVVT
jgi:SNF2 family DNA or RNA helicase